MVKKEKKLFFFLFISHVYCLISSWFNAGDKINYPGSFFWHLLAWGCTGNTILTVAFVLWKLIKRPKTNKYSYQVISLIVMISNIITMLIYGLGLVIGLLTALTTYLGITSRTTKLVPIPSHIIDSDYQLLKAIQGWIYSPLGHFIAPAYFIVGFFRHERMDLLKKKLKLTILLCLVQPALYFFYGYLRSKLVDKEYLKKFKARWVMDFLSSKKMSNKLGIGRDYRFIGKIILVLFGFSLFSLIVYLTLRYRKKVRNYLINKKTNLERKRFFISRLNKRERNKKCIKNA